MTGSTGTVQGVYSDLMRLGECEDATFEDIRSNLVSTTRSLQYSAGPGPADSMRDRGGSGPLLPVCIHVRQL